MMFDERVWKRCVAFHGHECPGLAIGVKAVEGVLEALGRDLGTLADDSSLTCVSENDTCPVDAIRCLLGCTEERGNLAIRPTDELAFTFHDDGTGRSVRLCLKPGVGAGMPRPEKIAFMLNAPASEMFDVTEL